MPSMPSVPLMSASPSFSSSSTGASPADASASAADTSSAAASYDVALAHDGERAVRQAAPGRPSSRASRTRARTGVMPALSRSAYACAVDKPHAGAPARERGQAQQHERAHDLGLDARTGARGVRADERALELGAHGRLDVPGRERAEAGAHAVDRPSRTRELFDVRARCLDGRARRRRRARRAHRCGPRRRRLPWSSGPIPIVTIGVAGTRAPSTTRRWVVALRR